MQILDFLLRLFDQIIDFFRRSRTSEKEKFDQFFKPLYDDLHLIHNDYLDIFSKANNYLQKSIHDPKNRKGVSDSKVSARFKRTTLSVAAFIASKRLKHEPLRRKLLFFRKNQHYGDYLQSESEFLNSIGCYMSAGSCNATIRTSTTVCTYILSKNPDIHQACVFFEDTIDAKRGQWDNVNEKFLKLQLQTWRRRTIVKRILQRLAKRKRK